MWGSKVFGLLVIQHLCLCAVVHAQFYETIRSDRPGQSLSSSVVGQGIIQIQTGVDYFGSENNNIGIETNGYLINTAIRYGLKEMFEVSALVEYKAESATENDLTDKYYGLSNVLIGLRYQLSRGKGILPGIGFQFRMHLPVMSGYYDIDHIAPGFLFVTNQQLSRSFALITNMGCSWNGMDATPTGLYTINLSYSITDSFGVFIENYGNLTDGVLETRFDTGIAWLVTKNLQLDILGGFGNNNGLEDYFISTGFSWRTPVNRIPIDQ